MLYCIQSSVLCVLLYIINMFMASKRSDLREHLIFFFLTPYTYLVISGVGCRSTFSIEMEEELVARAFFDDKTYKISSHERHGQGIE